MQMPLRYVGLRFHIDTNRINSRQALENMNQLEEWAKNGVIELDISERALEEASAGNDKKRRAKAINHIYSKTYADTPNEQARMKRIEEILFPGGTTNNNQKNDVEIVFNAGKYCYILVTNDGGSKTQPGGILGNVMKLKQELDIEVMSDANAVDLVKHRIAQRDGLCRRISQETNEQLPEWVGLSYPGFNGHFRKGTIPQEVSNGKVPTLFERIQTRGGAVIRTSGQTGF